MHRAFALEARRAWFSLMPPADKKRSLDQLIAEMGKISGDPASRQFLARYKAHRNLKAAARTLSTSIQPTILLGEYDKAFHAVEQAREIFARLSDLWRLARLEINAGNIYYRQDRFEEAIAHYERAYAGLMPYEDAEGIAVVLSNMAVCLISLNDFPGAL